MIKAKDLRVGNIIASSNHDRHVVVSYHEIRYATINEDNPYIGIPLTAEILEKCNVHLASRIAVFIESFDLRRDVIFDGHFNGGIIYVHQLQNLYFALTGEELPISSLMDQH
jgi:hypothetical protein